MSPEEIERAKAARQEVQQLVPYVSPSAHQADAWLNEFGRSIRAQQEETEKRQKAFPQLCDESNEPRRKAGGSTYSYDIYEKYGTGIY